MLERTRDRMTKYLRRRGLLDDDDGDDAGAPPALAPDPEAEKAKIADYLKVPHLIRALAAKEFRSCIKVVGRSESECKDDLRVSLPVLPSLRVHDDGSVSAVLGTGLFGKKSVAVYRGPELGCTLTESE